jgi:hypothetical protein
MLDESFHDSIDQWFGCGGTEVESFPCFDGGKYKASGQKREMRASRLRDSVGQKQNLEQGVSMTESQGPITELE